MFVRVSLVGIEILTIDARIVVASVDTFLRFAEMTNRLDLYGEGKGGKDLPELVQGITEGGVKGKTTGILDAAVDKVEDMLSNGREEREESLAPTSTSPTTSPGGRGMTPTYVYGLVAGRTSRSPTTWSGSAHPGGCRRSCTAGSPRSSVTARSTGCSARETT